MQQRLGDDLARHFGLTDPPIWEDNWNLADPQAQAENAVGHFDLKCVAVGAHRIEIERG